MTTRVYKGISHKKAPLAYPQYGIVLYRNPQKGSPYFRKPPMYRNRHSKGTWTLRVGSTARAAAAATAASNAGQDGQETETPWKRVQDATAGAPESSGARPSPMAASACPLAAVTTGRIGLTLARPLATPIPMAPTSPTTTPILMTPAPAVAVVTVTGAEPPHPPQALNPEP